jgi:hypothetical protein
MNDKIACPSCGQQTPRIKCACAFCAPHDIPAGRYVSPTGLCLECTLPPEAANAPPAHKLPKSRNRNIQGERS